MSFANLEVHNKEQWTRRAPDIKIDQSIAVCDLAFARQEARKKHTILYVEPLQRGALSSLEMLSMPFLHRTFV